MQCCCGKVHKASDKRPLEESPFFIVNEAVVDLVDHSKAHPEMMCSGDDHRHCHCWLKDLLLEPDRKDFKAKLNTNCAILRALMEAPDAIFHGTDGGVVIDLWTNRVCRREFVAFVERYALALRSQRQ